MAPASTCSAIGPRSGTVRSPTITWLLTIVTLGVYAFVHHHEVNRELREYGVEVRPVVSVLALVPGVLVIVPPFVTVWRTSVRIGVAQETAGLEPTIRAPLGAAAVVLGLFAPYHQYELNRVWRADP
jgi:hypothetical protein